MGFLKRIERGIRGSTGGGSSSNRGISGAIEGAVGGTFDDFFSNPGGFLRNNMAETMGIPGLIGANLNGTNRFLRRATGSDSLSLEDILLSGSTFGLLGGNLKDGLGPGVSTRAFMEGIGHITGLNMQRKAMEDANTRLMAEEHRARQEAALELQRAEMLDRQASGAAGGIRAQAGGARRAQRAGSLGGSSDTEIKDFLGLS